MFVTVVHAMLFVIILVNVLCGSYNTVTNLGILCNNDLSSNIPIFKAGVGSNQPCTIIIGWGLFYFPEHREPRSFMHHLYSLHPGKSLDISLFQPRIQKCSFSFTFSL